MFKDIQKIFTLSYKSIAFARVLLGVVCFLYFIELFSELNDFYGPDAVLSYSQVIKDFIGIRAISLFNYFQSAFFVKVLFGSGLVSSIAVITGFRPKIFLAIIWFIIFNVYLRNPILNYGGDQILKISLIWFILLPCNYNFSFFPSAKHLEEKWFSRGELVVSFAWFLQIFIMYEMSFYYKINNIEWRETLHALYYVFNADYLVKSFGLMLLSLGLKFTQLLVILTLNLEFIGPFILFIFRKENVRILLISTFLLFHIFIWLAIDVGFFSPLCMIWWVTFLPDSFWHFFMKDRFEKNPVCTNKNKIKALIVLKSGIALVLITFLTITSINQIYNHSLMGKKFIVNYLGRRLQIHQYWAMFADRPPLKYDGWFVGEGQLKDGKHVDVITGLTPNYGKPKDYKANYPTIHWRSFTRKYRAFNPEFFNEYYLTFLCKKWNMSKQDKVNEITLYFMNDETNIPSEAPRTPVKEFLATKKCDISI